MLITGEEVGIFGMSVVPACDAGIALQGIQKQMNRLRKRPSGAETGNQTVIQMGVLYPIESNLFSYGRT